MARPGEAWRGRQGAARHGAARLGLAWQAGRGMARHGGTWHGRQGEVWSGTARPGTAWQARKLNKENEMADFQQMVLAGRLGRDPELKFVGDGGTAVCRLSVAHSPDWKDKDCTNWYNVSIWGRRGEAAAQHLSKGSQVIVTGVLKLREYEKDGTKRQSLDLLNASWNFYGSRDAGDADMRKDKDIVQATLGGDDVPF